MAEQSSSLIPVERIEHAIYLFRGQKVMFDFDLAALYGVPTNPLIQAVKRNAERIPADFMFQMSKKELENWRLRFVTSNSDKQFKLVFDAIRELMTPPEPKKRPIGFLAER